MLRQPSRGLASASRGRISPYATTMSASSSRARSASSAAGIVRLAGCSTATPSSSARRLIGLATSACPRPAGRSGRVSTAAMRWCERARASSAGSAKLGVPAKPTVSEPGCTLQGGDGGAGARLGARGALPALLLQPPADQLTLELGEVVDEQLALEMIHLVLDTHRQQAFRIHLERRPIT